MSTFILVEKYRINNDLYSRVLGTLHTDFPIQSCSEIIYNEKKYCINNSIYILDGININFKNPDISSEIYHNTKLYATDQFIILELDINNIPTSDSILELSKREEECTCQN